MARHGAITALCGALGTLCSVQQHDLDELRWLSAGDAEADMASMRKFATGELSHREGIFKREVRLGAFAPVASPPLTHPPPSPPQLESLEAMAADLAGATDGLEGRRRGADAADAEREVLVANLDEALGKRYEALAAHHAACAPLPTLGANRASAEDRQAAADRRDRAARVLDDADGDVVAVLRRALDHVEKGGVYELVDPNHHPTIAAAFFEFRAAFQGNAVLEECLYGSNAVAAALAGLGIDVM